MAHDSTRIEDNERCKMWRVTCSLLLMYSRASLISSKAAVQAGGVGRNRVAAEEGSGGAGFTAAEGEASTGKSARARLEAATQAIVVRHDGGEAKDSAARWRRGRKRGRDVTRMTRLGRCRVL